MNNYIIDPSVFYWINVLGILQTVFAVVGVLMAITSICFGVAWRYYLNEADVQGIPEEQWPPYAHTYMRKSKMFKKFNLILAPISIVFVVAAIFIPGKTTSVEMLVAKTATFDNVNWTVQQVKEIVDYIVSSLKGVV